MRNVLVAAGAALVMMAGAVQWFAPAVFSADADVTAENFVFEDSVSGSDISTINVGDTVTWTFADSEPHTVTSSTGAFSSGAQQVGGSYQFTFNSAGLYEYYCEVHGTSGGAGMAGTVNVQAVNTNTPQPTNTSAPGATNTPTRTATRTSTPQATSTGAVTAIPTAAVATSTPIVAAPISATQPPSGGAGRTVAAPNVGTGDGTSSAIPFASLIAMALATTGALAIGGSLVASRRP
jgi:plastocyanin